MGTFLRSATLAALTATMGLSPFLAYGNAAAQPRLTFVYPEARQFLAEPPKVIHMCFDRPVDKRDLDDGGDWHFRLLKPDGAGLGMRVVFQPDALGFDIYPGTSDSPTEGDWVLNWRVRDAQSLEPTEGQLLFAVGPGGDPLLAEPPARCILGGQPSPAIEDGTDILPMALLTTAAIAGAAALGLILYAVRLRLGFWLHRPPPEEQGNGEGEHH